MTGHGSAPEERPRGRLMGIDLGEKRIGLALGEAATHVVAPFATIRRSRDPAEDAGTIARIAAEQGVEALVVGLPLDMTGDEGPQAIRTRAWADRVADVSGLPVRFRDERLTSERAEHRIGGPPRGRAGGPPTAGQREARRARIDREAAALILQDEFDAIAGETHPVVGGSR